MRTLDAKGRDGSAEVRAVVAVATMMAAEVIAKNRTVHALRIIPMHRTRFPTNRNLLPGFCSSWS